MNRRPGWQVALERRREKGETTVERKNKEVGQTALRQEKSCGALCFLTENGVRQVPVSYTHLQGAMKMPSNPACCAV